jgi:5-methylcytosine-specific restriction enzyme A
MAQPYGAKPLGPKPYNRKWQAFRLSFLAKHPLCVMCRAEGRVTAATVVDHIVPHRGDSAIFWREGNHQALCAPHHNSHKQSEERRGYSTQVGLDGWPVDDRHPALKSGTKRADCP